MLDKRWKKFVAALLAVGAIYVVRETGLDAGLIDSAMDGVLEALFEEAPVEEPAQ